MHCNQMRLRRRELEFHVCTINKSANAKKSLETYRMPLVLPIDPNKKTKIIIYNDKFKTTDLVIKIIPLPLIIIIIIIIITIIIYVLV